MAIQKKLLKKFFLENPGTPVKAKQVARALGVKASEYRLLRRLLREMAGEGIIHRIRRNCYTLAEGGGTLTGRVELVRKGYGFVIPDNGGRDVFIKSFNLAGAFHGDRVEVRIIGRPSRGNPEGVVLRVISRARNRFMGLLQKKKGFSTVIPEEDSLFKPILVPEKEAARFKHGQKVLVEVFDWIGRQGRPLARIVASLDEREITGEEIILLKYGFPESFPSLVLKESKRFAQEVTEADLQGRRDFRHLASFTIDPPDAQDFDDALSAVLLPGGDVEVGVHIADVSHYVSQGSEIDREARRRAMSIYLNESYVPMLPPELSSGICSLTEGQDRLTFSLLMRFSPEGELKRSRILPGVIRSRRRYDYETAQQVLESADPAQADETVVALRMLAQLCRKRRAKRKSLGQIDFDLPEPLVLKNKIGEPVDIRRKPRLETHRLVEEFMVTANEIVASRLHRSSLPGVYRIHEAPDPPAVENINYQLRTLDPGLSLPNGGKVQNPVSFSRIIERAEKLGFGELASGIIIQGMKRALYSIENIGHFGLATNIYTHFTSPIRRYPDLVVHRLLKKCLRGEKPEGRALESLEDELALLCAHCSQREQMIETAERESDYLVQARFMQGYLNRCFTAIVTAVKPFGFRVRLKDYYVEGFVHVSQLSDDYYYLEEKEAALVGRETRRKFRLGQPVELILIRSDPETRKIDFIPLDIQDNAKTKIKRHRKGAAR